MKVVFDSSLKVAGIGMVPWRRLGPERWFPNFVIASLYDKGEATCGPPVVALSSTTKPVHLERHNTRTLLAQPSFQKLIDVHIPDHDLMPYRAIKVPAGMTDRKFIMPNERLVRAYENKVAFRQKFSHEVPFAPFTLVDARKLQASASSYQELHAAYPDGMVIQDARLSGGQGTYIVKDSASYERAVTGLLSGRSEHDDPFVVSSLILAASELSIQACVTEDGIYTGPLQHQIIRHPLLALNTPGASGFCGIQITASGQGSPLHMRVADIAMQLGKVFKEEGYRGIFGVDLLASADGVVYVLEVNPRITGATPLLSMLYREGEDVPFYLLHILELGGYEYQITDRSTSPAKDGALLVVHTLSNKPTVVRSLPSAGTYRVIDGSLRLTANNLDLNRLTPGEFICLPQTQVGEVVAPGGMLTNLVFNQQAIDIAANAFSSDMTQIIEVVRGSTVLA